MALGALKGTWRRLGMWQQYWLDRATPWTMVRWITAVALLVAFFARIYLAQGWYIVAYALAIYILNLFLAFLTPKIDPAMAALENDTDDIGPMSGDVLPTSSSDEFRPFMRRLPEFKFWWATSKATTIALFCTFFEAFNIPVFWPILVLYFFVLFTVTMKRQIRHMIKYRYLPFSWGKPKHIGHGHGHSADGAPIGHHPHQHQQVMPATAQYVSSGAGMAMGGVPTGIGAASTIPPPMMPPAYGGMAPK